MASITDTVQIVFGVVDNATGEIQSIDNKITGLSGSLVDATEPIADFTIGLLKVEAAAVAAGAALTALALNQAIQVQTSFAELAKTSGETRERLKEQFSDDIREKVDTYGVSVSEVVGVLSTFTQAGIAVEDALGLLDVTLKANVISNLSAAQAANVLRRVVTAMELDIAEASGVLDVLNAISNTFNTTAGELGKSLALLSPIGNLLSTDYQQLSAILTPVLAQFQDGERTGRGLTTAFVRLATLGTKPIIKTLNQLGVAFKDEVTGKVLPGIQIIENLALKFGELDKETQLAVAGTIGMTEQAPRLKTALNGIATGITKLKPLQNTFVNLTAEQVVGLQNLGIQLLDSKGKLSSTEITIQKVARQFGNLTEEEQNAAAQLIAGAQNAGLLKDALDGTGAAQLAYLIALNSVGSAQDEFNVRASVTSFLLQRLSANIGVLASTTGEKLLGTFTNVVLALLKIREALQESVDAGAFDKLFTALNARFQSLATILLGIANALPAALGNVDFDPFLNAIDNIRTDIEGALGGIDLTTPEGLAAAIQKVIDLAGGLVEATRGIVRAFVPVIALIAELGDNFSNLSPEAQETIGSILGVITVGNKLLGTFAPTLALIFAIGFGLAKWKSLWTAAGVAIGGVSTAIAAVLTALAPLLVAISTGVIAGAFIAEFTTIDTFLNDFIGNLLQVGQSLGTIAFDFFEGEKQIRSLSDSIEGVPIPEMIARLRAGQISIEEFAKKSGLTEESIKKLKDSVGAFGRTVQEEAKPALESAGVEIDKVAESALALQGAMDNLGEGTSGLGAEFSNMSENVAGVNVPIREAEESWKDYQERLTSLGITNADLTASLRLGTDAAAKQTNIIAKFVDGAPEFSGAQQKIGKAADDAAKKLDKEKEAADKLQIKLEEIASNERIKALELKVKIDIAEIEAETKKVEAAFESIDTSVESTGDLIGDLFGALGSVKGLLGLEKLELIEKQLEIENKRRQDALDLQKKLVETQIKLIEAKTRSLNRGDPLITVKGDGLEPELEAFMIQILKKIQLQAAAEGAEFLLGLTV